MGIRMAEMIFFGCCLYLMVHTSYIQLVKPASWTIPKADTIVVTVPGIPVGDYWAAAVVVRVSGSEWISTH